MNDFEYAKFYWEFIDQQEDLLQKYIYGLDISEMVTMVFQQFSDVDLKGLLSPQEVLKLHKQIGVWLEKGLDERSYRLILQYFQKKKRIRQQERLSLWLLAVLCVYYQQILTKSVTIFQKAAQHSYEMAWEQAYLITQAGTNSPPSKADWFLEEINPALGMTLTQRLWADAQYFKDVFLKNYQTLILKEEPFDAKKEQKLLRRIEDLLLKRSKPDSREANGHHGVIDKQMSFVIGYTVLKAFRDAGVKKYKFIATIDERTTDSCRGLNGKVFRIEEAKIGVTVPPIADPPHPCRSVIRAVE